MDDIIKLEDHISRHTELHEGDASDHQFLIDEGLELLSAYRSISDRGVRLALKELVERVAERQRL